MLLVIDVGNTNIVLGVYDKKNWSVIGVFQQTECAPLMSMV